MARNAVASILIRARDLTGKALRGVLGRFNKLRKAIFSIQGALQAGASLAIFNAGKKSFQLGLQAEETANKFNTVFGPSAQRMNDFLGEFSRMAGLSQVEGLELAAVTAQIGQGMGLAQDASAGFAEEALKLAGDLASFSNLTTADVLQKINAGLTGEFESLKRLGIVLRQTEIDQLALEQSGKRVVGELTNAERATAAMELITRKAGVAVGDLTRTQDSAANQAKQLWGELKTMSTNLGLALTGAVELSGGFEGLSEKTVSLSDWINENIDEFASWGAFVIQLIKFVINVFGNLIRTAFNVGEMIGNVATLIGEAFRAMFDPTFTLEEAWDNFKESFQQNVKDIVDAADSAAKAMVDVAIAGERAKSVSTGETDLGLGLNLGGGPAQEDPDTGPTIEQRLLAAAAEAQNLNRQLELNIINERKFREELGRVGEPLAAIRDDSEATAEQQIRAAEALGSLADTLQGINDSNINDNTNQILSSWQQIGQAMKQVGEGGASFDETIAHIANSTMTDFVDAFGEAAKMFVQGSEKMGAAFGGAMLGAVASISKSLAKFYTAKGIAALGEGIMGDPRGFAAAAQFFAAAAGFGLLAGALSGASSGGGGSSQQGIDEETDEAGRNRGEVRFVFKGRRFPLDDPEFRREFAEAMEEVTDTRMIIEVG